MALALGLATQAMAICPPPKKINLLREVPLWEQFRRNGLCGALWKRVHLGALGCAGEEWAMGCAGEERALGCPLESTCEELALEGTCEEQTLEGTCKALTLGGRS